MNTRIVLLALGACLAWTAAAQAQVESSRSARSGCLSCHEGIEPIREAGAPMMEEILELGRERGDPAGCVVCHGGDPQATEKQTAHGGPAFFADPGSSWINAHTCGQCHEEHVRTQWRSLMMTEAGKIQGVCWAFGAFHRQYGAISGYHHLWGNYDVKVENPEEPESRLGTPAYQHYMQRLRELDKQRTEQHKPLVFVDRLVRLPDAPTDLGKLAKRPELAALTYLRNQCLRCHHAVKGRQVRGDYRGMGCSSCHVPYGNEGLYEGADQTIARDEPGHPLVHCIQATREAKVTVHGVTYSGVPVETCTTCHDRGKRIGVSFQGLMETPYKSPFGSEGGHQPALHTKHYIAMHQDIHHQKGMLCMDCHTSTDVHGDRFLAAANLAAVEIECADCHGTPRRYPWELPLGFGDEFDEIDEIDEVAADAKPRGTTQELLEHTEQGTVFPPRDGYLLSARGNPYGNVVRSGNMVIVHTAGGEDLELWPLKLVKLEKTNPEKMLSLEGLVAMNEVRSHTGKMECYACHASWAPQCYGCHVKIDYSGGKTSFDWLAAGHRHGSRPECRADRGEKDYPTIIPGQIEEQRSYLRWEDPPLGFNGERRITPLAPGCQASITVIGADGKPLLLNHIFRTPAGTEGAGDQGQLAIDLSPLQPHTMTKRARSCESCHASAKALGYGVGAGRQTRPWNQPLVVELETADQRILPKNYQVQCEAIQGLEGDWSRVVTEQGRQLMTVGHHFAGSRPLSNRQRNHIDRRGICLSCHREIPRRSLAVNLLHHVAEYSGKLPATADEHHSLTNKILLMAGWTQVGAMIVAPLAVAVGAVWYWRRRRRRNNNGKPAKT